MALGPAAWEALDLGLHPPDARAPHHRGHLQPAAAPQAAPGVAVQPASSGHGTLQARRATELHGNAGERPNASRHRASRHSSEQSGKSPSLLLLLLISSCHLPLPCWSSSIGSMTHFSPLGRTHHRGLPIKRRRVRVRALHRNPLPHSRARRRCHRLDPVPLPLPRVHITLIHLLGTAVIRDTRHFRQQQDPRGHLLISLLGLIQDTHLMNLPRKRSVVRRTAVFRWVWVTTHPGGGRAASDLWTYPVAPLAYFHLWHRA